MVTDQENKDIRLAVFSTDQLAADCANEFDRSLNVSCKWATGDNAEFEAWLARWDMPTPCPEHVRAIGLRDTPFTLGDMHNDRYISQCGGGERFEWIPLGGIVIGRGTTANWYLIPGNEDCPAVLDYEEPDEDC